MALTLSLTVRHGMGQDLVPMVMLITISTKAAELLMLVVMSMTIVTTINVETLFDSTTRSVRAGEICIVFSRGLALTCSTKAGNKTILFRMHLLFQDFYAWLIGSTHFFLFNMFVKSGNADDHNQRGNILALHGKKGATVSSLEKKSHLPYQQYFLVERKVGRVGSSCVGQHGCLMWLACAHKEAFKALPALVPPPTHLYPPPTTEHPEPLASLCLYWTRYSEVNSSEEKKLSLGRWLSSKIFLGG